MEIENSKQVVESTKLQAHGLHKPMFAKSGDKLMTTYVKNKNIIEQNKKKCTSKLPRFVRNSSFYRTNKNLCKQNGKDNAGDIIIGTNKRSNRIQKPKSNEPHKQKPSGIPRRKDINEESITDNASLKKQSEHLFEAKNIQRIQMLINADLCPEDRTQATSVVSAKPIPTLGQIYRPDSLIETDRFHDWFMSLNTPLNSFEFNPAIQLRHSIDSDHRESPLCDVEIDTSYDDSTLVVDRINLIQQIYKTTNESVKEWITSDVECLGVDNESGYRSSSPENLRRAIIINSKQTAPSVKSTHENNEINVTKKTSVKFSNDSNDIEKEELFEHEEYILKVKELNDQDRECRKENISYIECPSEILQKTINFEGCDSSKTVSSILATDTELIEELSSQCTLERIDDCSILEVHSADDWTPQCKSRRSENLLKTPSNDKETALKYLHRNSREHDENNSRQHYHNSNCWKKQLLRQKFKTRCSKKERCKKCRRFRTYPSIRYRFTKRLDSFRKQLWVRICRKRWNHVWKKTAERWALWSKSPSKLKKVRMMHYLQRAIIWEDAKVQTTLLVFRETGTGTVLREQKSAAISALIKFESNKYYDLPNTSKSMSKKSRINSGPSMFPFLHNSKEKFLLEKNKDNFEMMLQHSYAPEKFATVKNNCNKEETFDNIINKIATSTSPIFIQIKNDIQSSANHIQLQMPALMDAGTQMYIDYHNEETDAFRDRFASSVATVTSSHVFHSPSAANTETKHIHADNNKDTESENKIKKSYDIETQAVPTRPIRISRAITTPPIGRRDCTVAGTTTSVDAIQKKHFAVQAIPLTTTFTYTKPKLLSISSAMMKTTSATVSKQDVTTAGVPGNDVNLIESCQGLTAPYPQNCLCNRADYKPCKNETKAADRLNSSSYIISHNPQNYKRTVNADIFITKEALPISTTRNDTIEPMKPEIKSMTLFNNDFLVGNKSVIIDIAKSTEETCLRMSKKTTSPTNTGYLIKKISSTGTYTKGDNQTLVGSINQTLNEANNNLAKEIKDSIMTTNAHFDADGRLKAPTGRDVESAVEGRNRSTTYTDVQIEARPILIEKATDYINKKSFVEEKSVSTQLLTNFEMNTGLVVQDGTTIIPSKKRLVENKSIRTSILNNVENQIPPESMEKSTCITNNISYTYFVDFGDQFQPEYDEQTTSIDNKHLLKENSLSTSKNVEEETTSIDYTTIPANNRSFIESQTQCQTPPHYIQGEYHPPPCVNHNLLMSELFYKLNHTVDEMATQTEQHHNEVGTTPSAALPKPCQLPKFATAVPTQTSESFINKVKDTEPCRGCACAAPKYDCGTSTKASNLACATQTSPHQRNKEITISACNQICSKPSRKQIPNIHDPINDKIVSLSRLIGQRDANTENNSHRHPSSMPSSALNATNWIKTCASLQRREYACQSVENCDKSILEDLKHLNSDMITSTSEPYNKINNKPVKHKDFVISTLPAFTLSRDSLADVLPIQKVVKCISSTEIPSKDPIMVDQATSDVVNVKDVKECTLQACPEISNKATDFPVSENRKSACVLTSRCLLPTAAPYCYPNSFDQVPKDCVFIYREPRCVVYNQQTDAEVQRKPSNKDVEVEPIDIQHQTHVSVGSSIPSGKPICYHKKSTDIAGEVLSPRVYKALYETTKLVFKEDLSQSLPINYLHQQPSFRNAAINSKPLNTDFKFTMVQNPEVRSATVMTTQCKSLQKSRHFVDQSTQPDDVETKDRDVDVNTQTHSACRVSFTDVTAEKDCSEDCVKTHLAASCRYYSNLLTKQIGRVKENLTRHLAPPTDTTYRYNLRLPRVEACTMKPSARQELGCQTNKICRYCDIKKPTAYLLSPTSSLTDICRYDREHLKSVYYILSAIEGRIRRLKANVPT
ncbi:uncharacterized protein LOC115445651 isoform X3 [Manduca sexta]|uniref:uncharacterized protein LOC115445651 isoform X3 n=1 Tax=Manduca sexta TaxID=7130 RepID=UPI0011845E21|nr:uncharacterized protein LOC115445651 isoform X3 [Manduca sexta]